MRNMRIFAWVGILLVVGLLAGCTNKDEVRLTADQLNGILGMRTGETLVIELPANPSAGYAWEVDDLDTALFEPVGETEFVQEKNDEGLVGVPETQIIRLKAIASGKTTLKLIYLRSFEQGVDPLDTKWLDVDIK